QRINAHATRLVPQQRGIEEEEFPESGLIAAMDAGHQARGRWKPRRGDGFVLAPRAALILLHLILPSPSAVSSSASLTDAHQGVTSRAGEPTLAARVRF